MSIQIANRPSMNVEVEKVKVWLFTENIDMYTISQQLSLCRIVTQLNEGLKDEKLLT